MKESQLPDFLAALNKYDLNKHYGGCNGNPIVKWGFQLMVLTFVRTCEVRGARWEEIDWKNSLWRVEQKRMKMRKPHIVPLCKQSLILLEKLREVTGNTVYNNIK